MLALSAAVACAYQLAPPLAQPRVPQRRAPPPLASFAEIGLRGELCDALEEAGITEPNDLQRRVMPALAGRADVLIGARTGSGKTLAYLLPIMQTLRTDEEQGGSRAKARRPRALVLLPTRELALQVRDVARSLCRPLKISVAAVHGGVPEGSQKRMLEQPVDLLVATPGRLLQAPACAVHAHCSCVRTACALHSKGAYAHCMHCMRAHCHVHRTAAPRQEPRLLR